MTRATRRCAAAGITLWLAVTGAGADSAPSPAAAPPVPPGIDTQPVTDPPPITDRWLADAPQISAASGNAGPDDTLVLTGARLSGASLGLWSGRGVVNVEPLRSDGQRMIAVVPKTAGEGVMLVWPERDGQAGVPIRVNAPAAWWAWPCRVDPRQASELRVFGRNLSGFGQARPVVVYARENQSARTAEVSSRSPYELRVVLPEGLEPGRYQVWVHNGTGGRYGWSEPTAFEVSSPPVIPDRVVRVDDYIRRGTGVSLAIRRAIRDVQSAGGGTVAFGAGAYVLDRPIIVPAGPAVRLRGSGRGRWDPGLGKMIDPQGTATVIRYPQGLPGLMVIDVQAPGSRISDLAVICDSDAPRSAIRLDTRDLAVRRCLVVRTREDTPVVGIHSSYRGAANHVIESNTIYGVSYCVRVGDGSDYVKISDNVFRGSFNKGSTTTSNAVVNHGGNQMILERCDFRGVDRTHGKVLSRTCLLYRSSIRNTYIAQNTSSEVGQHPSVTGVDGNTGEQYIFHRQGEEGGHFNVAQASRTEISVEGGLPAQVTAGGDWIVFITLGPGAGQWRTIVGRTDPGAAVLDRPWRVVPQPGSVAVIQQAFRHNIVYANTVDAPIDPGEGMKMVGVYFYMLAFENIVASNTLNNVAVGVAIASDADMPSAWNLVVDNTIEQAPGYARGDSRGTGGQTVGETGGQTGGYAGWTAEMPMFLNEHARGLRAPQRIGITGWIGLGNTFRSNLGRRAPAAAAVGWLLGKRQKATDYRVDPRRGLVMTVLEHNRFQDVPRGVLLSAPSNWTVLRGNTFTGKAADDPVESHHRTVLDPLIEP
jgi:hypothetical protein